MVVLVAAAAAAVVVVGALESCDAESRGGDGGDDCGSANEEDVAEAAVAKVTATAFGDATKLCTNCKLESVQAAPTSSTSASPT